MAALEGQVAWITGGGGAIGEAAAKAPAQGGAKNAPTAPRARALPNNL